MVELKLIVVWTVCAWIALVANIGIFALNLKLYTEMFKERAQRDRSPR